MTAVEPMWKHAVLSEDDLYRYTLLRQWDDELPTMVFVMLNPSTADAAVDDPTIRRCITFAKREGYGRLIVLNLYAFRATNPKDMLAATDPIGERNNIFLRAQLGLLSDHGMPVVAAWGTNANPDRVAEVLALVPNAHWVCLGTTKAGHPRHPLYVHGQQPLIDWNTPALAGAGVTS